MQACVLTLIVEVNHHFLLAAIHPSRKPRPRLIRICPQRKLVIPIEPWPCPNPFIQGPPPNSRKAITITAIATT